MMPDDVRLASNGRVTPCDTRVKHCLQFNNIGRWLEKYFEAYNRVDTVSLRIPPSPVIQNSFFSARFGVDIDIGFAVKLLSAWR